MEWSFPPCPEPPPSVSTLGQQGIKGNKRPPESQANLLGRAVSTQAGPGPGADHTATREIGSSSSPGLSAEKEP